MTILKTFFALSLFILSSSAQAIYSAPPSYEGEADIAQKLEIDKPVSLKFEAEIQKQIGSTEHLLFTVDVGRLPNWLNFNNDTFEGTPIEDDIGINYFRFLVTTEKSNKKYIVYVQLDIFDSKIPDVFTFNVQLHGRGINDYAFFLPSTTKITGKHKTNKSLPNYANLHEDGFLYGTFLEEDLEHFEKLVIPVEVSGKTFYAILKINGGYGR